MVYKTATFEAIELQQIPELHPIRHLAAHWQTHKQANVAILRASMRPQDIPILMRWLLILDLVEWDGRFTYRCRYNGTRTTELFGGDITGNVIDNMRPAEAADQRRQEFNTVLATGIPSYSRSVLPLKGRDYFDVLRGVFAASTTGSIPDQVVIAIGQTDATLESSQIIRSQAVAD